MSTLARRLAEKCHFGPTVLKQCTVSGYRGEPALPIKDLNDLRNQIFTLQPQFWANPLEFESIWTTCTVYIEQFCKTVHLNMNKLTFLYLKTRHYNYYTMWLAIIVIYSIVIPYGWLFLRVKVVLKAKMTLWTCLCGII